MWISGVSEGVEAMTDQSTAEFRLSITRALGDQLATTLESLRPARLTAINLATVQSRPGIYVLFLGEQRVYVGKASKSLHDRLSQHLRKVSGRTGLDHGAIGFVCVYVDEDLDAAAPEKLLIKKYRVGGGIPWNTNGFGNKDPGRNRDGSVVKAAHFDALYPINLDYPIQLPSKTCDIGEVLNAAKMQLPYLLRFDSTEAARKTYSGSRVTFQAGEIPTRTLIRHVVGALPIGWQATALPGYLILYPEIREYESALAWWRRGPDGTVEETPGPRHFAAGAVESPDANFDEALG
jgi:hypothetical protein